MQGMERYERMHAERSYRCRAVRQRVSQDIKRLGGGMMKWQPWCRKRSACLGCGRVRGSVSTRKDAGSKKRCRCGTCKCRIKTSVFGHPQDVNADLEHEREL